MSTWGRTRGFDTRNESAQRPRGQPPHRGARGAREGPATKALVSAVK